MQRNSVIKVTFLWLKTRKYQILYEVIHTTLLTKVFSFWSKRIAQILLLPRVLISATVSINYTHSTAKIPVKIFSRKLVALLRPAFNMPKILHVFMYNNYLLWRVFHIGKVCIACKIWKHSENFVFGVTSS